MAKIVCLLVLVVAAVSAYPNDPVIRKLDDGLRYQYATAADGSVHLSDLWVKASNLAESRNYDAERMNSYHLLTRKNPTVTQIIQNGNETSVTESNFDGEKKTRVLIHGWMDHLAGAFVTNLVPAILNGSDDNIIVVDWTPGSSTLLYPTALLNNANSGRAVPKFISWLNEVSGASISDYHIIGHGLGAHQASMVGKAMLGRASYVTALDASLVGYLINDDKFSKNAGVYTESIHTNAGVEGYIADNAHCDFYPNGGISMPGCASDQCDHDRSIFYLAESFYGGRFVGNRCSTYVTAMTGLCYLWGTAEMGGLEPKTGTTGIYHFTTNAFPPFARG